MFRMRALVTGLQLPEALRSDGDGLYFSDAAAGGVYRWTEEGVATVIPKRRGVGGLALHADGGVVVTGRTLIHVGDGQTRELFAPEGALGLNDLTTDAEGRVLVGTLRMNWREPEAGLPGEIWRIGSEGKELLVEGIQYPNGMAFSPDSLTLYVSDFVGSCVHAVDVETWARRVFATLDNGNADGLAVDASGRVWVATGDADSFDIFSPEGKLVDRVTPPEKFAVTLCFGAQDPHDLYLAAGGSIFHTRSEIPGLAAGPAGV
jgi:sugar lactone lactonase YvrE